MQLSILLLVFLPQHTIQADLRRGVQLRWLHKHWHLGVDLEEPPVQVLEVWFDVGSAIPRNRLPTLDRGRAPGWTCRTCSDKSIEHAYDNKAAC